MIASGGTDVLNAYLSIGSFALDPANNFDAIDPCSIAILIHNDIMLTVAHCDDAFDDKTMNIGGILRDGGDAKESIVVESEHKHPNWDNDAKFTKYFDLMLLKLETPSTQSPFMEYNIYERIPAPEDNLVTIFFPTNGGINADTATMRELSMNLQAAPDVVAADPFTTFQYKYPYFDIDYMFYADNNKGVDACIQDGTGPVIKGNTIVGLLSSDSCQDTEPKIFTRVSAYSDWITSSICDLSDFPPASCAQQTPSPSVFSQQTLIQKFIYSASISIPPPGIKTFPDDLNSISIIANRPCDVLQDIQLNLILADQSDISVFFVYLKGPNLAPQMVVYDEQGLCDEVATAIPDGTTLSIDSNAAGSFISVLRAKCSSKVCPKRLSILPRNSAFNDYIGKSYFESYEWIVTFGNDFFKQPPTTSGNVIDAKLILTCQQFGSAAPSQVPSRTPSHAPSRLPTQVPSQKPSIQKSSNPSTLPSAGPSISKVNTRIGETCGIFKKSVFCPLSKCGAIGRLFGWCSRVINAPCGKISRLLSLCN